MTAEQLIATLSEAIASRTKPIGSESRNRFAEQAGVSSATVGRVVNGRMPLTLDVFCKLAAQAGLSVELVGEGDGR
jgi:plasmid maintenance system antidote protein VapI